MPSPFSPPPPTGGLAGCGKTGAETDWLPDGSSTLHKSWLPSSIFSPWPGGDKREGAGCGDFFRSLLGRGLKRLAMTCLHNSLFWVFTTSFVRSRVIGRTVKTCAVSVSRVLIARPIHNGSNPVRMGITVRIKRGAFFETIATWGIPRCLSLLSSSPEPASQRYANISPPCCHEFVWKPSTLLYSATKGAPRRS